MGTAFVLKTDPFWSPRIFIPVIGMLLGNSMSSVAMGTERCLDQFRYFILYIRHLLFTYILSSSHAPMLETRSSLPLAVEAIRLALLPVITQLSVMGMVNIPGLMTGQIMAGTPMMEAVMYQQCIMFMIAASSTLGVIMSVAVSIQTGSYI
jgi:ABC-type iron transport system FetAB permease component